VIKLATEFGGKTVLDAGCGNGSITADLARAGFQVLGVDADLQGIELARREYPQVRFEIGDFSRLPPGHFDLVVSTEVVEHLYSPQDLVRYAYEALAPTGRFIITTPYHGYIKNIAIAVSGKFDAHHNPLWHGGHIKFWSRATLTKLLEEAGFRVTRFVGVGRCPFLWKSMIIVAEKQR
jgi:2-polyprenyl-3-methyl-5-hydroxy-6-metoxy-1,4-benzoquinol methylase